MRLNDMSDDVFAAYLAAFTDGEGYVDCEVSSGGTRITLANTVLDVLEQIKDRLGFGRISSQKLKPHWSVRYAYHVSNFKDCQRFLNIVYPYLQIKRDAADRLLRRADFWNQCIAATEERNRQIRVALASGEKGKDIAVRFGVSTQTVSRVKKGHLWPSEKTPQGHKGQGRIKMRSLMMFAPQLAEFADQSISRQARRPRSQGIGT